MPQRFVSYPTAFSGDYRANFYRPIGVTLAGRLTGKTRSILELPNNSELGFFLAYSLDCCSWDSWLQTIPATHLSICGLTESHQMEDAPSINYKAARCMLSPIDFFIGTPCAAKSGADNGD